MFPNVFGDVYEYRDFEERPSADFLNVMVNFARQELEARHEPWEFHEFFNEKDSTICLIVGPAQLANALEDWDDEQKDLLAVGLMGNISVHDSEVLELEVDLHFNTVHPEEMWFRLAMSEELGFRELWQMYPHKQPYELRWIGRWIDFSEFRKMIDQIDAWQELSQEDPPPGVGVSI